MDLTHRMRGKQIAAVMTNGHTLSIRLEDGSELNVQWVDDNGKALKGLPVIQALGLRLKCAGFRDLMSKASMGIVQ